MYPMTASKALSILQKAMPDYTLIDGGNIIYDAFNVEKGIDEPAYGYSFIRNETGDPYSALVFPDGTYQVRCTAY